MYEVGTLDMLIFSLKVQRWIEAKNVLQKVCQNCESRTTYKCLFDQEKNALKYIVNI